MHVHTCVASFAGTDNYLAVKYDYARICILIICIIMIGVNISIFMWTNGNCFHCLPIVCKEASQLKFNMPPTRLKQTMSIDQLQLNTICIICKSISKRANKLYQISIYHYSLPLHYSSPPKTEPNCAHITFLKLRRSSM